MIPLLKEFLLSMIKPHQKLFTLKNIKTFGRRLFDVFAVLLISFSLIIINPSIINLELINNYNIFNITLCTFWAIALTIIFSSSEKFEEYYELCSDDDLLKEKLSVIKSTLGLNLKRIIFSSLLFFTNMILENSNTFIFTFNTEQSLNKANGIFKLFILIYGLICVIDLIFTTIPLYTNHFENKHS
ncbi:hypothetical protein [Fusibacter ferrireducens]|uniref:Uncharacterized protein n=1 Tax=Fusibacter ferrireducens TaxID=2785058 RepID=A0ABR9ZU29_9FIRM|nr:hypothetical protein [Fusibacter ferrireducens]MBF4693973.1 hypothetical protein [Fusibacter ferrireducens]